MTIEHSMYFSYWKGKKIFCNMTYDILESMYELIFPERL